MKKNTKIQILDDEELLEVTGGLVQLVNPASCAHRSKEECHTLADVSVIGMIVIKHVLAAACRQCFLTNKDAISRIL